MRPASLLVVLIVYSVLYSDVVEVLRIACLVDVCELIAGNI